MMSLNQIKCWIVWRCCFVCFDNETREFYWEVRHTYTFCGEQAPLSTTKFMFQCVQCINCIQNWSINVVYSLTVLFWVLIIKKCFFIEKLDLHRPYVENKHHCKQQDCPSLCSDESRVVYNIISVIPQNVQTFTVFALIIFWQ